jgi:hypothetical protein
VCPGFQTSFCRYVAWISAFFIRGAGDALVVFEGGWPGLEGGS